MPFFGACLTVSAGFVADSTLATRDGLTDEENEVMESLEIF